MTRKLQSLPLKTKRKALFELSRRDQSANAIAKKYNVSPKTLRDWKKNAIKIFEYSGRNCRKMVPLGHSMKYEAIEDIIVERIKFIIECKAPISYDRIYKWIATQDFPEFTNGNFKASKKWYDGLLKRNGLVSRAVTQLTKKSEQYIVESIATHIQEVKQAMEKYSDQNIIFCDETAIWMDVGQLRTLAAKGANTVQMFSGFKEKTNITVMCAVRKNGDKIKPLIVNPTTSSAKLDTIEQFDDCYMGYTKKGWVTQLLLSKYLRFVFGFGSGLLVWDKASAHKGEQITKFAADNNIEIKFVPEGTTGYCQVADVGIIKSYKAKIRNCILGFYDSQIDGFQNIEPKDRKFQKPKIKDLRKWIVDEWQNVELETILNTIKSCYLAENPQNLHIAKLSGFGNFN